MDLYLITLWCLPKASLSLRGESDSTPNSEHMPLRNSLALGEMEVLYYWSLDIKTLRQTK